MPLKATYEFTMTWVQNLINIIGGNMDFQVSFDFVSAGMYVAQYEVAMCTDTVLHLKLAGKIFSREKKAPNVSKSRIIEY